jgi:hypothetical protein
MVMELRETSLCAWFAFWAQFIVLGFAAILGAVFAGNGGAPGDQICGVILILASFALIFMRLKSWFDQGTVGWGGIVLVDDMPNLVVAIVVFVILGLVGLFVAAGFESGGLHNGGVALALTSALGIFFSIKNVFDNLDRTNRHR